MNLLTDIRRPLAGMLFAIQALIIFNSVFFTHAHRLADGKVIVHAHPYWPQKEGCQLPYLPNNHTRHELTLLDAFSHALYTGVDPFVTHFLALSEWIRQGALYYQTPAVSASFASQTSRGPPGFLRM